MYRLEREQFLQSRFLLLWGLLGFQAGFINSFGFLNSGRFVSHVTGFGTQVGLALAEGKVLFAVEMFLNPLFFIFGAFASGIFTIARLESGRRPLYSRVTFFLPIALFSAAIAGEMGLFGHFGELLSLPRDFALFFLLSFLCGMQNGTFATLTKGQIRTTHLTGISTDIGSDLARIFFGKHDAGEKNLIMRANLSRYITFAGFSGGAIFSALIDEHLGYLALLIPFLTSFTAWIWVVRVSRH